MISLTLAAFGAQAEEAGREGVELSPGTALGQQTGVAGTEGLSVEATAARAAYEAETAALPAEDRDALRAFYAARDYAPYWTERDRDRGAALVAAVGEGAEHGLPLARYDAAALTALIALGESPSDIAAAEIAAMRTYMRFARDLAGGLLEPRRIDPEINRDPVRPTAEALLAGLDEERGVAEVLAAHAPADPEYRALISEKRRLERLLLTGGWGDPVPAGPTLHRDDTDPRVALLRARLERLGATGLGRSERLDGSIEAAVKEFQRAHGLLDDGVVGRRTLAAINRSVEDRLAQVLVNLERLRWMDDSLGERYIYVNIPDYSVRMVSGGATIFESRVVVGQAAETRTPEFSDMMTHMVVNPTWYIPDSIAERVYLPQLKSNPAVLANNNMRLFTRNGTEINPALVDWRQVASGTFPFRVRQNPSTSNALGQVKFMFPNQFAIYLHDTPAKELFARDARAFSNGCIRVERPFDLARLLLEPQMQDPGAALGGWIDAGSERYVDLVEPIPVHLVYRTAIVDAGGSVRYRDDVYGRDAAVFRALGEAGVAMPAVQG